MTPGGAQRALCDLSAEIDLRSVIDSWQDTLLDEQIPALHPAKFAQRCVCLLELGRSQPRTLRQKADTSDGCRRLRSRGCAPAASGAAIIPAATAPMNVRRNTAESPR